MYSIQKIRDYYLFYYLQLYILSSEWRRKTFVL